MNSHPVNIPDELMNIKYSLSLMSYNNVKWTCLYSGMGIIHTFSEKETKKILGHIELNSDTKDSLQNLVFLKCIYKKGKPQFSKPPEEIINPGAYMWDFTSFNKTIPVSAQCFAILSLCRFAEIMYNYNTDAGIIMTTNAQIYYNFMNTYLRNDEGLFVSGVDKTKCLEDELKIKLDDKNSKMIDQILAYEAFLSLYHTVSNKEHPEYYNKHSDEFLNEARKIFDFIYNSRYELAEMSSKNISLCISSLYRCCSIEDDKEKIKSYINLIILLCAELDSRIKITGEVERKPYSSTTSSMMTHFLTASALIEGYLISSIEKFMELALRILKSLDDFYNENIKLYIQGDSSKFSYSIKEIAEILKCLYLTYTVTQDEKILKRMKEIYLTTIELSGIVQSIPKDMTFLGIPVKLSVNIPSTEECNKPPVFLKSYKISLKKVVTHKVSKSTNSLNSLYASYIFGFYLIPQTDPQTDDEKIPDNDNIDEKSAEISEPVENIENEPEEINNPELKGTTEAEILDEPKIQLGK